ncbi:MAG: ATP-dependent DNA helicase RecG [Candidatus Colwellbacteria bacterium]|nr:ATP-dependent DNA helicase RecG [Candidatus Colwellbacteria bacterium]
MDKVRLDSPISDIHGTARFLSKLKRLEIHTVKDLLWHFPTRYEDWSEISPIADLRPGDEKTIQGEVISINLVRTPRRRMFVVEALISDDSSSITAVWFNQPYIKRSLPQGKLASFSGKATLYKGRLILQSPTYESVTSDKQQATRHTGRIVPIYRETKGLTSKGIRYFVQLILEQVESLQEFIPERVLKNLNLPEVNEALHQIHFPDKREEAAQARKSFAFRDLFLLQLKNLEQREVLRKQKAYPTKYEMEDVKNLLNTLPYELTASQKRSLWEILQDISHSHPMNRLLQGDVGSGKTIVAGIAAITTATPPNNLQALPAGRQAAFLAPTEILARQHFQTLTKFFKEFTGGIALLVAKETRVFYGDELEAPVKKSQLVKDIASGKIKIVIGTHALIQKSVNFNELALVVVDEQHRFGVKQRAELLRRSAYWPHLLSMSATPIPRTLMLSVFGDLDLSLIQELPKGRKSIITKIVAPANRDKAYAFIRGEVRKGKQVFVVCPRIETIDKEQETRETIQKLEVKSVKEEYEKLTNKIFPDLRIAMLHGKMKSDEKKKIMSAFAKASADKDERMDILVSTSVIEVGVDVPNATIMMIEGAERFGLAQLYQFRGRVGRGEKQSFCFLFTESTNQLVHKRLNSLLAAKNGFELAEEDLKIRGPGEFLGESQTGLPDIAMKALQDPELLREARTAAEQVIKDDPELKKHPLLRERLRQFQKEVHPE